MQAHGTAAGTKGGLVISYMSGPLKNFFDGIYSLELGATVAAELAE